MDQRKYPYKKIEATWQRVWAASALYRTDIHSGKNPYYNLMMFPYPSAEGLHVGNMYAFTGSDIFGRFKRMQGYDVFEPIGLDGFGIHSENYALKVGRHPMDHAQITQKNFYNQLHNIGAMYDWSRTIETYDPAYYKWTQWLFVQMFRHGLAYRDRASVNWCPSCKTVLADEQVVKKGSGLNDPQGLTPSVEVCERCGNKVEKRLLEQWFFRITEYAEKLLENSHTLNWSEKVRVAQQHWIGKKEGILIPYSIVDEKGNTVGEVTCFTTRPDTNFGATVVVLAPEHPLVLSMMDPSTRLGTVIKKEQRVRISQYVEKRNQSEQDRATEGRKKTGVFTGLSCINQLNNKKMPLYISDFVLMGFGTGAVVGVPGHDKRDFEFAIQFDIPIRRVVMGKNGDTSPISRIEQVQEEEGTMVNSGFLDGMDIGEATVRMMDYLEKKGWGKRTVTYHLRDWLISRQRYWGPPIPMIHCSACKKKGKGERSDMPGWWTVLDKDLPVKLPRIDDYKPGDDGVAPLAKHKEFYETTCPGCGSEAVRETDVSDTFLDSSWYFLRYPSLGDRLGVEGAGPAARVSRDSLQFDREMNTVSPSSKDSLRSEDSSQDALARVTPTTGAPRLPWDPAITKRWLPVHMYTGGAEHSVLHLMYARFVTMALHDWGYLSFDEPFTRFYAHGLVIKDGAKMSKSKGNVVNPDEYIEGYGADSLRMYLMFMGPFDQGGDFQDSAMEGVSRWVGRIWRMALLSLDTQQKTSSATIRSALHKAIKKVGDDLEKRRYNTAIATLMELTNLVQDEGGAMSIDDLKSFVLLLAPFAPHLAEELWQRAMAASHGSRFAAPFDKTQGKHSVFTPSEVEVLENVRRVAAKQGHWSVHQQPWPSFDPSAIIDEVVQVAVQVNGKTRDVVGIDSAKSKMQTAVEDRAKQSERVQKFLAGQRIKRIIFVPGKLINFVVEA